MAEEHRHRQGPKGRQHLAGGDRREPPESVPSEYEPRRGDRKGAIGVGLSHVDLTELREKGLLRRLRALPDTGPRIELPDGRAVLNLSSNDYLNLAGDERVKAAAIEAVGRLGCSARASRLMAGDLELCERLEADLARLMAAEAALVLGSGFLTNLGVLTAIAGRGDEIFADRLNHASLTDAMQLSGARWHRYRHRDAGHLESLLKKADGAGRRIVVTDSIFSMDGDRAPLAEIAAVARRFDALLMVDEAHAIGVFGRGGGGLCRESDCDVRPDFVVGTMSKSLGGYGGFVGCSKASRELLINRARSFIYSTGLPPACLGAAKAAVGIVASEPDLGPRLLAKAQRLRQRLESGGLDVVATESQILPVHVGGNDEAVRLSGMLWDRGVLATAVRPPTVPAGTARLRLSVTLGHADEQLDAAADTIIQAAREIPGIAIPGW